MQRLSVDQGSPGGATIGMKRLSVDQGSPGGDGNYDTKYQRSLRHYLTREALPKESNYRRLSSVHDSPVRPSLDELHASTYNGPKSAPGSPDDPEAQGMMKGVLKFGWIKGVLMRCTLNIWGVMLFLRVSWVVGQAGLWESLGVVVLGNTVTAITALSMSAVVTNGLIKGGGVYYMISRSLGPEFGGSIGLMFTLASSIAAATNIIGFVESLQDMLFFYFDGTKMIDGGVNDVRAIGTATLVCLVALAIVGMEWVTRVQIVLLVLLVAAQVDVVVGVFMGPLDNESRAQGFVGINGDLFMDNMKKDYRPYQGSDQNFISVFAVFFTSVTGIVAGANISGDLKNPSSAIPKGTLLAIAITCGSYLFYPFLLTASVVRDASGDVEEFTYYYTDPNSPYNNGSMGLLDIPTYADCPTTGYDYNETLTVCEFGLQNSMQVMELVSAWGPLIYLGCFAATLSSAIASLDGGPRILQALAKDKLYPGISLFKKGYGANNDPIRGYILIFFLSFACIMIGNLNAVSTLLSNFFLASYSLINFSCFHASLIKSPGWRPSFKYYNLWISLLGGMMCLVAMFLIDYITALITLMITIAFYLFVSYRKPDVNWGSSTQGATYVSALKSTLDLQTVEEHVKNYRPQILVLSGQPSARPPLIDLGKLITKNTSLMVCGRVDQAMEWKQRAELTRRGNNWLQKHKVRAFFNLVETDDLEKGASYLFQLSGLGKLKPNMVLLGLKSNWNSCNRNELKAYFNTLHAAMNMQLGIAILRLPGGIDYSQIVEDEDTLTFPILATPTAQNGADTSQNLDAIVSAPGDASLNVPTQKNSKRRKSVSAMYRGPGGSKLSKDIINNLITFQRKQSKGTIDVWWLYDDGGLTLLLPHILTTRANWSSCKLRIFALANRKDELDMEQRSMVNLLNKFRIDYGDVIVIPDATKKPRDTSIADFEAMIEDFKTSDETGDGCSITAFQLSSQKEKTNRHLRLREMLLENSTQANLIVMTLPVPRRGHVPASLYMAWLDHISKGMPPFLFVRGNQQSVLTFYS